MGSASRRRKRGQCLSDIGPGETFEYQIKIPEKHVGLFWFHPHMYGNVDRQVIGGLSGGVIAEGCECLTLFSRV
jgi:FtsP/CotA-like multicopper oxidase with cupredoxin domain